jgi:hypothetical protein
MGEDRPHVATEVSGGVAAKTGYDLRIECNALCETIG